MQVQCPSCSKVIPVTPKLAGRKVKCSCDTVLKMPVPSPASSAEATQVIEISCASCSRQLRVDASAAGKMVKCPCGTTSAVPTGGPAPPSSPMPAHDPFGMPVDNDADDPFGSLSSEDGFGNVDGDPFSSGGRYEVDSTPAYMKNPKAGNTKKKKSPSQSSSSGADMGQVLGGIGMMVGAVIWFVVGLFAGVIFFYPPILLIIGFATMIKGFLGS